MHIPLYQAEKQVWIEALWANFRATATADTGGLQQGSHFLGGQGDDRCGRFSDGRIEIMDGMSAQGATDDEPRGGTEKASALFNNVPDSCADSRFKHSWPF
jgi:hypothetical protein